jgi:hypothetical protein
MIPMTTSLPTDSVQLGNCRITFQKYGGPRILQLQPAGGPPLFAETPQTSWETPNGTFYLRGGHRLWAAPEAFPRSYSPDNDGPPAVFDGRRLTLSGAVEPSGLRKSITVESTGPLQLTITHQLANCGMWPIRCAPWAITQLQPGGQAVIPLRTVTAEGLVPDRTLRFWPYSSPADQRFHWADDFVGVDSATEGAPAKIGTYSAADWAAYLYHGTLFIKQGVAAEQQQFPHGCNLECYIDRSCLELETLSPLSELMPGATTDHREHWIIRLHVETTTFAEFHQLSALLAASHAKH